MPLIGSNVFFIVFEADIGSGGTWERGISQPVNGSDCQSAENFTGHWASNQSQITSLC
jgi:hypothetical protein